MLTVYSKPSCVQCTATTRHLNRLGVPHTVKELDNHPDVLDEAYELGFTQAPIVKAPDGEVWSGFRPDLISAYAPASV